MCAREQLKKAHLFHGVSPEIVGQFEKGSRQKAYIKGAELFSAGDRAICFFLILEGWVKLYRMSSDGEEAVIHVFGPGETFAEAAVFSEQQKYPVSAQAVEDLTVLEVPRKLFVDKISEDSNFALSILSAIAARQHYLVQQIEQITVKSAPQRIGAFLLRLCQSMIINDVQIKLPYDKALIARRLNIQPETFSRALAKLKPYGVSIKGRIITIHDVDVLGNFCDVDGRDTPGQ